VKYFMHDNNLRNEPEIKSLAETVGSVGAIGIASVIWECLCAYGDDEFHLPLKGKFGSTFWAREFGLPKTASKGEPWLILQNAASAGVIDYDALSHGVVWAPELRNRLDRWTSQKFAAKRKNPQKPEAEQKGEQKSKQEQQVKQQ
jgi:hypothetical protein